MTNKTLENAQTRLDNAFKQLESSIAERDGSIFSDQEEIKKIDTKLNKYIAGLESFLKEHKIDEELNA